MSDFFTANKEDGSRLVRLKPGRYLKVSESPSSYVTIDDECPALLIEEQGKKSGNVCWHILVEGAVLLAWDDNFRQQDREAI